MVAKVIEIRDRGTLIPALAVQMGSPEEQEHWLLSTVGFGRTYMEQSKYVVLCQINSAAGLCTSDPYDWPAQPRTWREAHKYVTAHFNELTPGAVVDVEFILGETAAPKTSDRRYEIGAIA